MGIRDDTFVIVSDWIYAATNQRPYILDSNFIRPSGTYITCKLVSADPASWQAHKVLPTTEDGRTEVYQYYLLTYQIACFRNNSNDIIFDLAHSLREPEMRWILNQGKLGYSNHSNPIDRSIQIDNVKIEERSVFNAYFYYAYNRSAVRGEAPGYIDGINIFPVYSGLNIKTSIYITEGVDTGVPFEVFFQFSAPVTSFSLDNITTNGGVLSDISSNTEKNIYTATFTPTSGDKSVSIEDFKSDDNFIVGNTLFIT